MKKITKTLCLLLAVLMLLPVFAACNKNEQKKPEETTTATPADTKIADISKKNYNKDFTIVNPEDDNFTNYYWSEDYNSSSNIALANYEREVAIEDHLGIEIYHETLSPDSGVLYSTLERNHMAGLDAYQLVFTHPFVDLVSLMGDSICWISPRFPELRSKTSITTIISCSPLNIKDICIWEAAL